MKYDFEKYLRLLWQDRDHKTEPSGRGALEDLMKAPAREADQLIHIVQGKKVPGKGGPDFKAICNSSGSRMGGSMARTDSLSGRSRGQSEKAAPGWRGTR
jgi:hypothetical protein